MRRPCHTCRHRRGPSKALNGTVLIWTCNELVEPAGDGTLTSLPTAEARRYCVGDFWSPDVRAVVEAVTTRAMAALRREQPHNGECR